MLSVGIVHGVFRFAVFVHVGPVDELLAAVFKSADVWPNKFINYIVNEEQIDEILKTLPFSRVNSTMRL